MKLIECFLTRNACYQSGKTITPEGVMIHSTGANNPRLSRYVQPNVGGIGVNVHNNDWNRLGVGVCVHAFIGKLQDGTIATVQTLPWDRRGWHAGGSANNTHIGFEICEDGLTDKTYFDKVYREAVELTAYLCGRYGLNPLKDGVVICHSEGHKRGVASNHADVMHWFPKHGKSMDDFRAEVDKAMRKSATTTTGGAKTVTITLNVLKRGDKGAQVEALQALLICKDFGCGSSGIDGSFGPATDAAVRKYQKAQGLTQNGVVEEKTWGKLLGK